MAKEANGKELRADRVRPAVVNVHIRLHAHTHAHTHKRGYRERSSVSA